MSLMQDKKFYVRQNAKAFVETLEKLSPKERALPVSARYANELNKLITQAKEVEPNHDADIWPEPIPPQDPGMGVERAIGTYAEVETAARQIVGLLPLEPMM